MGSSLYAGISGLNASSKQLDVIGNNIANANTIGYRSAKIHFGDILSQSLAGGTSFMQVGRGVSVNSISTQFSPGSFETTANATDLAIDGDGFFMVNDGDGGTYYTRAGSFHLDSNGYLVNVNDYKVQGYSFFGSDPNAITDISLQAVQSAPEATSTVSIGLNLDAETATGSNFNAAQTVYDSLGAKHTLNMAFQKTEESGYWGFQAYLDNDKATAQTCSGLKFDSNGVLDKAYTSGIGTPTITTAGDGSATAVINNEGQLYKSTLTDIVLTRGADADTWAITDNGSYSNMSLTLGTEGDDDEVAIDFDGFGGADITFTLADTWANTDTITFSITQTEINPADVALTFPVLANGASIGSSGVVTWDLAGTSAETVTGYASASALKSLTADGYGSGLLKDLSVTQDGILSGFFTNGQTANIGQIVLADFSNPGGLRRMGNNLFAETITSGSSVQNIPGSAGMGEINANSLEMSNTDIATEFINMITAQRAYQANAKVVTTTDAMMSELMNIKR